MLSRSGPKLNSLNVLTLSWDDLSNVAVLTGENAIVKPWCLVKRCPVSRVISEQKSKTYQVLTKKYVYMKYFSSFLKNQLIYQVLTKKLILKLTEKWKQEGLKLVFSKRCASKIWGGSVRSDLKKLLFCARGVRRLSMNLWYVIFLYNYFEWTVPKTSVLYFAKSTLSSSPW